MKLIEAVKRNNLENCRLLLNNDANVDFVDKDNRTLLYWAVLLKHELICKLLLQHGAKPDIANVLFNQTPLYWASFYVHESICRLLLEHGANPNITTVDNQNPLYNAVIWGCESICRLLLEYGADITKKFFQMSKIRKSFYC